MTRSQWFAAVLRRMNAALALNVVVPIRIRLFAALAALLAADAAQAQVYYYRQPVYRQPAHYQPLPCQTFQVSPGGGFTVVQAPAQPAVTPVQPAQPAQQPDVTALALAEVNAKRAARGLRPYIHDAGLAQAARACSAFRAANGMFGHTANDFAFVPAGTVCTSTGCAAYPQSFGWMSCDVYDNYTYAGAAWAWGRDGKRYMHLFVR